MEHWATWLPGCLRENYSSYWVWLNHFHSSPYVISSGKDSEKFSPTWRPSGPRGPLSPCIPVSPFNPIAPGPLEGPLGPWVPRWRDWFLYVSFTGGPVIPCLPGLPTSPRSPLGSTVARPITVCLVKIEEGDHNLVFLMFSSNLMLTCSTIVSLQPHWLITTSAWPILTFRHHPFRSLKVLKKVFLQEKCSF